MTDREVMELAYGLLWLSAAPDTESGQRINTARAVLGNALDFNSKKAGIMKAQENLITGSGTTKENENG